MLTQRMLQNHFLKEIEITCLLKRDLNWWSRNAKVNLLTIVSMSFSNKLVLKDWIWTTPITDMLNLERKKLVYKKNNLWRKNFSEILKYEIFMNWVKCRELKNYELTKSQHNKKKTWDNTKAHFTGMIQENFKKWNRITVGECVTFPGNQQRFRNLSRLQENVFANPRSTLESSRTPYQGILHSTAPSATSAVPVRGGTGTPVAWDEERIGSTHPMPMFAGTPSTMKSLLFLWIFHTAKWLFVRIFHWMQRNGSKKWRRSIQWTT